MKHRKTGRHRKYRFNPNPRNTMKLDGNKTNIVALIMAVLVAISTFRNAGEFANIDWLGLIQDELLPALIYALRSAHEED